MRQWILAVFMVVLLAPAAWAAEHRFGGGVNYWVTLDDIDVDDTDESGFSYLISYQYDMGLLTLELDGELLPDRFGETAFAPEAYLILGKAIYAGAGIGIIHSDGEFADEPFFALRAGLNLELLPAVYVDISANYRFNDTADLDSSQDDIDTDTVFLGAAVRISL